ncbi:MAG: fused MFS/spermidine synthase [Deltaproteobacteria bacterium]|nr:fused MFS/spermidine synthase [Deltaproteobacteria bacterium]
MSRTQAPIKPAIILVISGLGCLATAAQVNFIREFLTIFSGNELCLGIIFACWFIGIVVGAFAGGRLADRVKAKPGWLAGCSALIIVMLPLLINLLRNSRSILNVPVGELPGLGALLVCGLVLITPFGLLIGISFPLVCRLAAEGEEPSAIGRSYVFESVGAIFGGLAVGIFLAGRISTLESTCLTGLPLIIGFVWLGFSGRGLQHKVIGLVSALIGVSLVLLLASGLIGRLDDSATRSRFDDLKTGTTRVAFAETPYHFLDLGKNGDQFTLFYDGKVTTTFPDRYRTRPRSHLVLTQHPDPKRVLLLGSASFEFLPVALAHSIESLDVVELDPEVISLIRPYLDQELNLALDDQRVKLHTTDGRRFLAQTSDSWDLIFSDAPDPLTAGSNRFFTLEFFKLIQSRLTSGGVFATRLSSSATFLGRQTASLVRTLQASLAEVFATVEVLPGGETFFLACDSAETLLADPLALGNRYEARQVVDQYFSRHHFNILLQVEAVEDLKRQLNRRGEKKINSDARPVTYLQSIVRWGHMTDSKVSGLLASSARFPAWSWFVAILVLFGFVFCHMLFGKRAAQATIYQSAWLAIFAVGAAGLALELLLTFSYQSLYGSLYSEMGLIVAAFMTGLVGGGYLINRRLRTHPATLASLGVVLLGLAGLAAGLPGLLSPVIYNSLPLWAGQGLILLLLICVGLSTGIVFPLSSQVAMSSGRSLARVAGNLDALDHLGAAIGAFITGLLLVPVLGRTTTCFLIALGVGLTGLYNLLAGRLVRHRRAPTGRQP